MSELLRLIVKNYKAYLIHKIYLAISMIYMYSATIIAVPILTALTLAYYLKISNFWRNIIIGISIIIGLLLFIIIGSIIRAILIEYYMKLFGQERRKKIVARKMELLYWFLAFALAYLLSDVSRIPQYVNNSWLLGIGMGNLITGMIHKSYISIGVGITCAIAYFLLIFFPPTLSYDIAFFSMLYSYVIASIIALFLSKKKLKEVAKDIEQSTVK